MRNWQVVGITRRLWWREAEYRCSLGAFSPGYFRRTLMPPSWLGIHEGPWTSERTQLPGLEQPFLLLPQAVPVA